MVKENTKTKIDGEKDICHPIYVLWGHTLATECRQINDKDVLVDKDGHIEKNIFFTSEVINSASQTVRVQCEL